jgi:hypothetical protein
VDVLNALNIEAMSNLTFHSNRQSESLNCIRIASTDIAGRLSLTLIHTTQTGRGIKLAYVYAILFPVTAVCLTNLRIRTQTLQVS